MSHQADLVTCRLFSHTIRKRLFDPAVVPHALQAIRSAIFPDNAMGPARVPPSADEVVAIRRECARVIVEVIPAFVRSRYFATEDVDMMREDVEDMLNLFADQYVNKHLIISVVELLVVRLFPEIADV